MIDNKAVRDYAREALEERGKGDDGYYGPLLDFIGAVAKMDARMVDVQIMRLAKIDLNKLRKAGL